MEEDYNRKEQQFAEVLFEYWRVESVSCSLYLSLTFCKMIWIILGFTAMAPFIGGGEAAEIIKMAWSSDIRSHQLVILLWVQKGMRYLYVPRGA